MLFCPGCGNVLLVNSDASDIGDFQFACQTCPYVHSIKRKISSRIILKRKEVDDVLGGEGSWDNVDSTEVPCPKCDNRRAYFMQIQIRSADEPMSTFYKCTKCAAQWREG
ncbi:DNA-directed RNA polymerase III subunit RPC10 [Fonticula alba]|uniref:DNA-directed RNA polymerase subunit n=1 Tax=Fonticula alba TaxID=691883 RepID=A0A058ZBP1_FONAL|nr:DNA-directed RNA polymerase III subunit RPC10 [Fonticula alba]KCV71814.1 DNA-directed RNA polymerase III subunit RPC10 [Fonticula alba]|eukprot:XP_009493392.1 DNA-directed RNA polymerase III subunit RPC10 [Fonticula alba]